VRSRLAVAIGLGALLSGGCAYVDTPYTWVNLFDDYPATAKAPYVIYAGLWGGVTFPGPMSPGSSSGPQPTVPSSPNTAYVIVAPGWEGGAGCDAGTPPSLLVLQSRTGYGVSLSSTVDIHVDDATFAGNCAAGSHLTQSQADFITRLVFPCVFAGLSYDAETCTVHRAVDAGTD
jgi:hypothetical protein